MHPHQLFEIWARHAEPTETFAENFGTCVLAASSGIDEDRVHTMKSHDARGVTLHVYAGDVASFRLFDETARVTLRARGGAWLPADVVLSEERWEPVP